MIKRIRRWLAAGRKWLEGKPELGKPKKELTGIQIIVYQHTTHGACIQSQQTFYLSPDYKYATVKGQAMQAQDNILKWFAQTYSGTIDQPTYTFGSSVVLRSEGVVALSTSLVDVYK